MTKQNGFTQEFEDEAVRLARTNGEGQPWPNVHGIAGLVIIQENINLSVINLHNFERSRNRYSV